MISYEKLPPHMRDGARRWVEQGIPGGSFMNAVMRNDFLASFGCADEANTYAMRNWAMWLYNDAPSGCHGSPAKVAAWEAHRGLAGIYEARQDEAVVEEADE